MKGDNRSRWTRADRQPTLEDLTWLQSTAGCEVCAAMAGGDPADTPAAVARWRRRLTPEQVAAAWAQVLLRRVGRSKFSRADRMFFDRVGLEQATDEVVAAYKARRFAGLSSVADLCCGIGGDAIALAADRQVTAVDFSPLRLAMAEYNAAAYDRQIISLIGDVGFTWPPAEAAHVDPDRRPAGRRSHCPQQSSPGFEVLQRIVRHYEQAAIKFSPAVDFEALPFDAEVELISHAGECKQAVVWTGRLKQVLRRATILPAGESISAESEESLSWPPTRPINPGCILFEPDPAVIRADLVGPLARMHNLGVIDERIAYLVGDQPIDSPMFKPFRVLDVLGWSAKKARLWLAEHDVGCVDVKTRGFAASPEQIQKVLKLAGQRQAVLFLTRVDQKPIAILAERL